MRYRLISEEELYHYGVKGQKWGVRRYQNADGTYTPEGAKRHRQDARDAQNRDIGESKKDYEARKRQEKSKKDDEYDEERERHEQEVAKRRGVEYVRKTKKEREAEDAEEERKEKERRAKEDDAYEKSEERMKKVDEKIRSKYKFDSDSDYDKYYKEYDEEWFKILYEERKKRGLSHMDMVVDELYHYGIKGQKWGRRQYQNKDGSLTEAGKKRYGTKDNFEKQYPVDKKASDISAIDAGRKGAKNAREINRNLKEIEREKTSKKQKIANKQIEEAARDNARRMSDQELRDAVNRLNMEENYTRMMSNRNYIDVGESAASKFMDKATKALVVTEAALSIALIVRQLKN